MTWNTTNKASDASLYYIHIPSEIIWYTPYMDLVRILMNDILILDGYGHLDVYANPNNVKDVNEPVHNWLVRIKD